MPSCYFCEKNPKEYYLGYYCQSCRKIKNILNIYGVEESLNILESVCIRNEEQRKRKINYEKKKIIAENVELISNVHLEGNTKIGKGTKIFPFAFLTAKLYKLFF